MLGFVQSYTSQNFVYNILLPTAIYNTKHCFTCFPSFIHFWNGSQSTPVSSAICLASSVLPWQIRATTNSSQHGSADCIYHSLAISSVCSLLFLKSLTICWQRLYVKLRQIQKSTWLVITGSLSISDSTEGMGWQWLLGEDVEWPLVTEVAGHKMRWIINCTNVCIFTMSLTM